MHIGSMPLCGVHPAQETNQNASILFVSYKTLMPRKRGTTMNESIERVWLRHEITKITKSNKASC